MDNKGWFVSQVRERYIERKINLDQFEHDLTVAVKLDEGILPAREEVPTYLRDKTGRHLLAPPRTP